MARVAAGGHLDVLWPTRGGPPPPPAERVGGKAPPTTVGAGGSPSRTPFCSGVCCSTDAQQTSVLLDYCSVLSSGSRVVFETGGLALASGLDNLEKI